MIVMIIMMLMKMMIGEPFSSGAFSSGALGAAIGKNTCLKGVKLKLNPKRVGLHFYRELAENRSIETLSLGAALLKMKEYFVH